jgi:hypothetical protein
MPTHNFLASRMLIDQLTPPPHLPKDNEEVNVHVKRIQAMFDATIVVDPNHDRDEEAWVTNLTTNRVPVGT